MQAPLPAISTTTGIPTQKSTQRIWLKTDHERQVKETGATAEGFADKPCLAVKRVLSSDSSNQRDYSFKVPTLAVGPTAPST